MSLASLLVLFCPTSSKMAADEGLCQDHLSAAQHAAPARVWGRTRSSCEVNNIITISAPVLASSAHGFNKTFHKMKMVMCSHYWPIGLNFFLYVNHRRESTSEWSADFSAEKRNNTEKWQTHVRVSGYDWLINRLQQASNSSPVTVFQATEILWYYLQNRKVATWEKFPHQHLMF